jgi:hypothetical protein
MAMELLAFHDQFVADFSPDDQDDDFFAFDIIQHTQVARSQLECSKRIWTQTFNRFARLCRFVFQSCSECCFQDSLFTREH